MPWGCTHRRYLRSSPQWFCCRQQWISRVAHSFNLESRALPLQRATDYAMQRLRDKRIGKTGVQEMEAQKQ